MGFIGTAIKGGIAAKLFSEARKPRNQQKVKGLLSSLRNRGSGADGTKAGRTGTKTVRGAKASAQARPARRRP